MQTYNLTDTQKELLKWIVSEVRAGKLNEEEIWAIWDMQGTSLVGYQGHVPEIKKTTLDALEKNGCLTCSQRHEGQYKCALLVELLKQLILTLVHLTCVQFLI